MVFSIDLYIPQAIQIFVASFVLESHSIPSQILDVGNMAMQLKSLTQHYGYLREIF